MSVTRILVFMVTVKTMSLILFVCVGGAILEKGAVLRIMNVQVNLAITVELASKDSIFMSVNVRWVSLALTVKLIKTSANRILV